MFQTLINICVTNTRTHVHKRNITKVNSTLALTYLSLKSSISHSHQWTSHLETLNRETQQRNNETKRYYESNGRNRYLQNISSKDNNIPSSLQLMQSSPKLIIYLATKPVLAHTRKLKYPLYVFRPPLNKAGLQQQK